MICGKHCFSHAMLAYPFRPVWADVRKMGQLERNVKKNDSLIHYKFVM
jgi:hypothetical protein